MNILALDLGTKTGYAYNHADGFHAGFWELASAKEVTAWGKVRLTRRNDPRVERLCERLSGLGQFDAVIFEDVQFQSTTYQCQLWSAFRSAAWLCADGAIFEAVPVGTLKKFATGSGSADKPAMARALIRQRGDLWKPGHSDDTVDAIWLWLYAQKNLTRLNTQPKLP